MPQLRTYEITRVQKLRVTSVDVHKALLVAEAFLDDKPISSEIGRVLDHHVKTSMNAEEQ